MDITSLVSPYSPWLLDGEVEAWRDNIPPFRRPLYHHLINDLREVPQIISITGPRRVGKSTILQQLVDHLLSEEGIQPERVVYYSMDDPVRFRREASGDAVIETLMSRMCELGKDGPAYLFLDEIQTLERWELYLKKYHDLKYPIRIMISGSASSPIFKKSRESLLGRVKDYHLLPFSFREFMLYQLRNDQELVDEMNAMIAVGDSLKGMLAKGPEYLDVRSVEIPRISDDLWTAAQDQLEVYMLEGGFPEVWQFPTQDKKIEYLFDNQVKKVIEEDLVLAAEFRKPEQLKRFYISLLEQPGREVNLTTLSQDIGVGVQQIEKYLPLLEMTDLISHADKFRKSPIRVRRGNQKFYLVDLALRNAVLRIGNELFDDDDMLGLYAENLVFNALKKWQGVLAVDFYRDTQQREVDFIVHTRPHRYVAVEAKYRQQIRDLKGIEYFMQKYPATGLVITRNREHFGGQDRGLFYLPLIYFLILFD